MLQKKQREHNKTPEHLDQNARPPCQGENGAPTPLGDTGAPENPENEAEHTRFQGVFDGYSLM